MSGDRQDSARALRDGELLLLSNVSNAASLGPMAQMARPEPMSKLLEVLERRSQQQNQQQKQQQSQHRQSRPRRRKDAKQRLVSQWKQTLALSSVTARKLVTTPQPAPKATPRRAPPRPPNPLRSPGPTDVSRIRREDPRKSTAPAPAPKPIIAAAPTPEPIVAPAPPDRTPTPSRWIPTLPSLSTRIAEAAVQTAGTLLLALAVKTGTALANLAAT